MTKSNTAKRGQSSGRSAKATAKSSELVLTSGQRLPLDGNLVFLIDALYREFAVKRGFAPAYGDVQRELEQILDQLDADTTREYFAASLFLNYVTYENEMADRVAEQFAERARGKKGRTKKKNKKA